MAYWLFKSEPNVFGIDDLQKRPKQIEPWDGVRNYQARNMLREDVKKGDLVLFYHSSCEPPGVAGIMKVVKEGYPDVSAQDPNSPHFDPKSSKDNPIWYRVDVQFVEKFKHYVSLNEIKLHPKLKKMRILQKGNRLSITPLSKTEWDEISKMGNKK